MVKLIGPCMSMKARGSLASTIVFTANRRTNVLKRQNRKHNRNTILQRSHRSMLRYLAADFRRLIPPAAASWRTNVPDGEISPFHWYMKTNLAFWRNGEAPTAFSFLHGSGGVPIVQTWSVTNHKGLLSVRVQTLGALNVSGGIWHRVPSPGFPPSPATAIDVWHPVLSGQEIPTDRPTEPGTYFYRLQLFNNQGKLATNPLLKVVIIT